MILFAMATALILTLQDPSPEDLAATARAAAEDAAAAAGEAADAVVRQDAAAEAARAADEIATNALAADALKADRFQVANAGNCEALKRAFDLIQSSRASPDQAERLAQAALWVDAVRLSVCRQAGDLVAP